MNKNILLCDVDSTMLNLALAKISAYHKKQGDAVELLRGMPSEAVLDIYNTHFDDVYISCIFDVNKEAVLKFAKKFYNSNVHLGGSGIDLKTELPAEIEDTMPDNSIYHDIYPESIYTSYGFSMRGCIRKCPFCIVPTKEGKARPVGDLYSVWNKEAGHTHVVFFDNNVLALLEHFKKVADQVVKEGLKVDWNQALDIRLVTPGLCI